MASWQRGHGQGRSALPGLVDPTGSLRASRHHQEGEEFGGKGHCAGMWLKRLARAGQKPRLCQKVQTAPSVEDSSVSLGAAGTRWRCPLTTNQQRTLRERAVEFSSLGSPELALGSQQLPPGTARLRSLVQPRRGLRDTTRLCGTA